MLDYSTGEAKMSDPRMSKMEKLADQATCPTCGGSGSHGVCQDDGSPAECGECGGEGIVTFREAEFIKAVRGGETVADPHNQDAVETLKARVFAISYPAEAQHVYALAVELLDALLHMRDQHATALEIGRGIGREEAAKVCEVSSDAAVEEAATSLASGDTKGRLTMITHHLCAQGLAAAIRSTSPALDVEGMVMLAIKADMARQLSGKPLPGPQHDSTDWSAEGDFQSLDLTEIACAVLASLGIKNG